MSNVSKPVKPSDWRVSPFVNSNGRTPMPTRFDRWIRSNDSAITARTPRRIVPLAAQSRDEPVPYSLPAMMTSGVPCLLVRHRRVVDGLRLAARLGRRPAALGARRHLVAQADVRERAAHHHFVIAAPRAVRVEVLLLDAVLDQPFPGRARRRNVAGRRDVVGRDRIAEHRRARARR